MAKQKAKRLLVLMVLDPDTECHRFGGVFTQKKHLWGALEDLGVATGTLFYGDEDDITDVTYNHICRYLRKLPLGGLLVIQTDEHDKAAVISQVEQNAVYRPQDSEQFDVPEDS